MTEEKINKEARKYAQPYFDEAFKHTTPSVSAICEHEGEYIINAFKAGAKLAQENQWINGGLPHIIALMNANHRNAKYVAFCEGDDYWTDDFKLEKQISLMLDNPNCTLTVHPCYFHKSETNKKSVGCYKGDDVLRFGSNDILKIPGQFAPTASYVIKRDVVDNLPPWYTKCPVGDFLIEMYSMKLGYGMYIPDIMCAYRIFSQKSWSDEMRKNDGLKMVSVGKSREEYIKHMEADSAFSQCDFTLVKSCILLSIAEGYLYCKNYKMFNKTITESYLAFHYSSKTQKWLYKLRDNPRLALLLLKFRKYICTLFKYK